jgi:hypothetical protein
MVPSWAEIPGMAFPRSSKGRLSRDLGKILIGVFGLLAPARAAEPESAPPALEPPDIIRPAPLSVPVDDLPTEEPVEVILELVIDTSGRVESARALTGSEPFTSHAVAATDRWVFQPAYVRGKPTRTRIQFLVRFEPKPPAPPAEEVAEPATSSEESETPVPSLSSPPRASAEQLDEVTVLGRPGEPLGQSLTRSEVRNLAGAFGDPLRGMEILPGVTTIATGLPLFFVRGSPPANVGFFIDGIRIPFLYHGFLGPSVLHPAFIDDVTLHAGPMPVRFGRFAGAALEAGLATPSHTYHGQAHLRLLDAGAFVEAPFGKDGRGYAMVGGRYSFTALLVPLFAPGSEAAYWDYQAAVGYDLSRDDELRLFAFGGYDSFTGNAEFSGGTEFHRVDLSYKHRFSGDSDLRIATTFGRDRTRSSQGYASDTMGLARMNYEARGDLVTFQAGGDLSVDDYKLDVDLTVQDPETYLKLFPARTDVSFGGYMNFVILPGRPVEIVPGVRFDGFSSLGDFRASVDPRLFVHYRVHRALRIAHGVGLAHQSPNFVPGIPAAVVGGLRGGLQESVQAESRFDFDLPWEVDLSLRGFINGTFAMSDPVGLTQNFSIDEESPDRRALGRAAGVEVYLKRPLTRRFGGILSYTFMGSLRSIGEILTPPGYNRTHTLNVATTYDFGNNVRGSLKIILASGVPGRRTDPSGFVFDQSPSAPLFRVDAKIEKRWNLTPTSSLTANAEVLNASYMPNVITRTCPKDEPCNDRGTAPLLLPSVGVEYAWW